MYSMYFNYVKFSIQNGDNFSLQISKQLKISFLISQPKPMLWVLKRNVSMRWGEHPKHVLTERFENNHKCTLIKFDFLNLQRGMICS